MRSYIWIGIFIDSTIGGLIPELWGGDMISYSGVLLSGAGALEDCGSDRAGQDERGDGLTVLIHRPRVSKETTPAQGGHAEAV
jgi:hypothetical protein